MTLTKNPSIILAAVILLFTIVGSLFYWYSYRPYQINKLCIQVALDRASEAMSSDLADVRYFPPDLYDSASELITGDQTDVRYYFWKCQKQHGISE